MQNLESMLSEHPFMKDIKPSYIHTISKFSMPKNFDKDDFLFHEGDPATYMYLITLGNVSVEIFSPGHGPIAIQTVKKNDILGWSWFIPPHQWRFDAKALELTRTIAIDGATLRNECEIDHELGYEILKRLSRTIAWRLEATRIQLVDLYKPR